MKKYLILALSILCLCLCIFIPSFSSDFNNLASQTQATISISGYRFVLTGIVGNNPQHYFVDDSNNSTLSNIEVFDNDQTHYSLRQDLKSSGLRSGGNASFIPTSDMSLLISKGLVYVEASMTVNTKAGNEQSNIMLTLSYDDGKIVSVQSNNEKGQTSELSTGLIKLSTNSRITYSFQTLSANTSDDKANFEIDMPVLKFYTQIDSVTLDMEDMTVNAGAIISLNAYNDVTNAVGQSGNFINYSKVNHRINYNFTSGGEYAQVVGDKLYISDNAPSGTKITFNIYSKQNSYNDTLIYSTNTVTLTVTNEQAEINIRTDFASPATLTGNGSYEIGERVTLTVSSIKSGYQFVGWYLNDNLVSTSVRYITTASLNMDIYAKFRKGVSVSSVSAVDKTYDGTASISFENLIFNFSGVENGHDITVSGVEGGEFQSRNVGEGIAIDIITSEEGLTLTGTNSDIYYLSSYTIPQGTGNITARVVTVKAKETTKQYGDIDPTIEYEVTNIVAGERLSGSLAREEGEALGQYTILQGTLGENDNNYQVVFDLNNAYFIIEPRVLTLANIEVQEKVYDGTQNAIVSAKLNNIYNNEDVQVSIEAQFVTKDAGYNQVEIINAMLEGKDRGNYILADSTEEIYGTISQKSISIEVPDVTIYYGETFNLSIEDCKVVGLIDGDTLLGELSMTGINASEEGYPITRGTIQNPNYVIESFESGICYILPKEITVQAESASKTYGDEDGELTFTHSLLAYDDILLGALSRESGEDVGEYEINIGSLESENPNYKITFTSNVFTINKRDITVKIEFLDKTYDGSNLIQHSVEYVNNIKNDTFNLYLNSYVTNANVGEKDVYYDDNIEITGENDKNYNFKIEIVNDKIEISRRDVNIYIENQTKIYGEEDPTLSITTLGVVDGEKLNGNIIRESGETCGIYFYQNGTLTNENNPNYNIILSSSYLEILQKELIITISSLGKIYGEEDPVFKASLLDGQSLVNGDELEQVLGGSITREEGERAGAYQFNIDGLCLNDNYKLVLDDDIQFIISRREVEVTINDASKTYGDDDPTYSYSVSNLVGDDQFIVSIGREYGEDVGSYELYSKTQNDDRYIISNVIVGYLTITKRPVTIRGEQKIKIYGESDPTLTIVVTSGRLVDDLASISTGTLVREEGENVGSYQIKRGTFDLGKNYSITYENGQFEIVKADITVQAKYTSKQYGDEDPLIDYQIVSGSLKFSDNFIGALSRDEGEQIGQYQITIGSLALSNNYNLTFISNTFEITKRTIQIVPTYLSKEYGDEEGQMTYSIIGSIVNGDESEFTGEVYRDKQSNTLNEDIGLYRIYCTLSHEKYNVVFGDYYFEILPRQITIKADDKECDYGTVEEPELTYQIISGDILEGDEENLTGEIYRMPGINAGEYEIRSSLTLGKNYDITFTSGTFTIHPLSLTIETQDYEKVYGQADPTFEYTIKEGELINGDILNGSITRVAGEDVGVYQLINSLRNSNYDITFIGADLTITPKDVYLVTGIQDKIYDGTSVAILRNPYVTGLLDDNVTLSYDRDNCARFASSEVGNNIEVYLFDITLAGEKAQNYNLILPSEVYGNIAYSQIGENEVIISSPDNAVLYDGIKLDYSYRTISNSDIKINSHKSLLYYNVQLENQGSIVELNTTVSVILSLEKDVSKNHNLYVYMIDESGNYRLVSSYKDDQGNLVIMTDQLGQFIVVTDNDDWIDIAMYVSIAIISSILISFIVMQILKHKRRKTLQNG